VSLGANAIANIASAVSGSVVSISNFPASQTVAGTVTANGGDFINSDDALITKDSAKNVVLIGGLAYSTTPTQSQIQAFQTQGDGTLKIYQEVTNWTDTNAGNQPRAASQQTPFPVQVLGGSVTIGSLPAISGTVTANVAGNLNSTLEYDGNTFFVKVAGRSAGGKTDYPINISGTVTVGNSLTISSLPAISGTVTVGNTVTIAGTVTANPTGTQTVAGTVTANVVGSKDVEASVYDSGKVVPVQVVRFSDGELLGDSAPMSISGTVTVGNSVTIGSLPAISGTVTVGGFSSVSVGSGAILAAGLRSGVITPIPLDAGSGRVAGSAVVQYNVGGPTPYQDVTSSFPLPVQVVSQGSVSVGQLPRVTFIDGSGTVVTANSAVTLFASSSTRSYLLVQVTTGSAFVNVGATATTVNGINLTAGQGYAWETTIPQGLVSLISTTTSSRWVAKEA
jgi:hypothetical protein